MAETVLTPLADPVSSGQWRTAARRRAGTPRGRAAAGRARFRLVGGIGLLVALVLAAALGPWLGGLDDRLIDYTAVRLAPSLAHPFGTATRAGTCCCAASPGCGCRCWSRCWSW